MNNKLYSIFNDYRVGPLDGGCWAMATALRRVLGGQLYTLAGIQGGRRQGQHVVLKHGDDYWDGNGRQSKEKLLKEWREVEMVRSPELRVYKGGDLPGSPRSRTLVKRVVAHLTK